MTTSGDDLSTLRTMRDVFDYCQRKGLYSVAQGMIELPPPRALREIVAADVLKDEAPSSDIHQYRSRMGERDYLNALRTLLKDHYATDVPEGSILATSGVTGAIVAALMVLRKQGKSRMAVIEPYYTYHSRQVEEVFQKLPEGIPSHLDWSPDFDAIEKALKGGVEGIIIANPNNPTGRVWAKEELQKLVALTKQYGASLILDEIYCDMVFAGNKHYSPIQDSLEEHVFVCRGYSKTLGAQSWRLGYAVSHPETIKSLMTHHDPIYISLAQYLNKQYSDYVKHINEINALLQTNYEILAPAFKDALGWEPIAPQGSMYGMFKHTEASDIEALQKGLRAGVGVAPGSMFYVDNRANSGYIRIHVGISTEKAKKIAETLRANKQ
ncbi:aminotransferase, class I/II superfamily protein [Acanthamoeba castellanii str. Neff]|uniref:Aminotransferase, class I/II superfamily protein n=1 Tax=Acanthamoeba castellanii (strain ATCC 30010 / Neff) TaxID=1257118 RepID=L8HIW5_ACACF|nr:aminotransferase, class I/II superfamily protein [Acanthamoeba castellanii str. Neff]ELR25549.1 aminotransferase, class I/II superfamily protein [Acanthamoeba castellanii str. Neff]